MNPLEDTIVAMRPVLPKVPLAFRTAFARSNPTMPIGDARLQQRRPERRSDSAANHRTSSSTSAGSTCGIATFSAMKRWT